MAPLKQRPTAADEEREAAVRECLQELAETVEGATSTIYLPPFRIDVTVRPDVPNVVSRNRVGVAVRAALDASGAPGPASIGVILSNDKELSELNGEHMGASGATDVLSFPFFPPEAFSPHERGVSLPRDPWVAAALKQAFALPPGLRAHLGDIIVSVERAVAQAEEGRGGHTGDVRWTAAEELLLLAVHGTLHFCGWDHAEPVEEAAMRSMERSVLGSLPHQESRDAHDGRGGTHVDPISALGLNGERSEG
jgi:probable rRNA maturation factor